METYDMMKVFASYALPVGLVLEKGLSNGGTAYH